VPAEKDPLFYSGDIGLGEVQKDIDENYLVLGLFCHFEDAEMVKP
jgi:hypothetical protein